MFAAKVENQRMGCVINLNLYVYEVLSISVFFNHKGAQRVSQRRTKPLNGLNNPLCSLVKYFVSFVVKIIVKS